MNQLSLQARILEMGALRHTPAGLPVLDLILTHESEVIEAGLPRLVQLTIPAKAIGQWGQKLASLPLGAEMRVRGFLAPTRKNSSRLVLHIQQAQFPGGTNTTDLSPSPGILA